MDHCPFDYEFPFIKNEELNVIMVKDKRHKKMLIFYTTSNPKSGTFKKS